MDILQAIMVEECALEGRRGIALPDLFGLVAARSDAEFDDNIKNLLWKRLRCIEEIDLRREPAGGGHVDTFPLVPKEELEAMDWGKANSGAPIRAVAVEATRRLALGLQNSSSINMMDMSFRILEEVGRGRDRGVTQKDLPQLMRVGEPVGEDGEVCDARLRKMDAKSLFHYMKTLKAAGVIKIKPLAFSKKDAPSSGVPQNVQTNLVCLARFEAEVPPEGGAFLVETDDSESRYVAEAIKVMLRAKDGLVRTTELKKLVTGAKAGARKFTLWKRIQKRLEASGKAESVSAMSSKGATVPCMRLKDSGGVVGIDSTPVLQVPQRHQYLAQIEDAGPDGITRMDISLSQWGNKKESEEILTGLTLHFGVVGVLEQQGKQKVYKYIAPKYAKAPIIIAEPHRSLDVPPGGIVPATAVVSLSSPDGAITKELLEAHLEVLEFKSRVVTPLFLQRINHIHGVLREERCIAYRSARYLLRQHDIALNLDFVIDQKTVKRLMDSLKKIGLAHVIEYQIAKRSTTHSDESTLEKYLMCSSVDLADTPLVDKLVAKASLTRNKIAMKPAEPGIAAPSFLEPADAPDAQDSKLSKIGTISLTLNGYTFPIAVRAWALHKHLFNRFAVGDNPRMGCKPSDIVDEMPVALYCQVVGVAHGCDELVEMIRGGGGMLMKDLEAEKRDAIMYSKTNQKVFEVMAVLEGLGLVEPQLEVDETKDDKMHRMYYQMKLTAKLKGSEKEYNVAEQSEVEAYWKECAKMFTSMWSKGGSRREKAGVADLEAWVPSLCRKESWVWRSEMVSLTPTQEATVTEYITKLARLDEPIDGFTIDGLEQMIDVIREEKGMELSKGSLAKFVSSLRMPALVPPFVNVTRGAVFGRGISMAHSVIKSNEGDRAARKRGAPAGSLTNRLGKQRKTTSRKNEVVSITDGEGGRGGDGGMMLEDDDENEDGTEEAGVGKGRIRPVRRRVLWREVDDVKLLALCGQQRKLVQQGAPVGAGGGEGEGGGSSKGTEEAGEKRTFDWSWVAKCMGMKRERVQRRHKNLKGDVKTLRNLERKIVHFGISVDLGEVAGGGGVEGDDNMEVEIPRDEDELKEWVLEYIREMHTDLSSIEDESMRNYAAAALKGGHGASAAPMPWSVEALHEEFKVQRLLPDDKDTAAKGQPWPDCTPLQNCLVEQLTVILSERVEAYDSRDAFETVHRFATDDVEEALRRLQASGHMKKSRKKVDRTVSLSKMTEDLLRSSRHYESTLGGIHEFLSSRGGGMSKVVESEGMGGVREWDLGATAEDGETAACIAMMVEGAVEATPVAPEEGEGSIGQERLSGAGLRVHLDMIRKHTEGDENERNVDVGALPELPTRFSVTDELWRGGGAHADVSEAGSNPAGKGCEVTGEVERMLREAGMGDGVEARVVKEEDELLEVVRGAADEGMPVESMVQKLGWEEGKVRDVALRLQNKRKVMRVRGIIEHLYVAIEHSQPWSSGMVKADEGDILEEGQVAGPWLALSGGEENTALINGLRASILENVSKMPGISVDRLVARYPLIGKRTMCDIIDGMFNEGLVKMRSHKIPPCSLDSPAVPMYVPRLGRGLMGGTMSCDPAEPNLGRYLIPGNTSTVLLAAGGLASAPWGGGFRQRTLATAP